MVTVKSSDGNTFQVEEAVFMEFRAVDGGGGGGDGAITLSNVSGETLGKVIDYCKKHIDHKLNPLPDDEINAWNRDFLNVDEKSLFDLLLASHFLGVKELFNLTCQTIADMVKGNASANVDQLRNLFMQMQILL